MQFTTLQSPQNQQSEQPEHVDELLQAAAAPKSATLGSNQDEEDEITTFYNLREEVERLKEAAQEDSARRDGGKGTSGQDEEGDEQYEIHYGEKTGSSLGIYILPSDEDHSSSAEVDELREETPTSPYQIFHGKQSQENDATGNYGSYGGGSNPQATPGGDSNNSGLSDEESKLRDILNNVKQLGLDVNVEIHKKSALEKNGYNDPLRAPSNFFFYNPDAGGATGAGTGDPNGGETIAPPRGNEGPTNQPTYFGKRNCKAANGVFGDNRQERSGGGVTLKFRYELNTDATPGGPYERASLYNEILPALEDAMTTALLPAFFSDECMPISTSGSASRRKIRGRFLRGGGDQDQGQLFSGFNFEGEEDHALSYQHQHRKLNRVIGIDSDPMDFPLNGEGKYQKLPACVPIQLICFVISFLNTTSCSPLYFVQPVLEGITLLQESSPSVTLWKVL